MCGVADDRCSPFGSDRFTPAGPSSIVAVPHASVQRQVKWFVIQFCGFGGSPISAHKWETNLIIHSTYV